MNQIFNSDFYVDNVFRSVPFINMDVGKNTYQHINRHII